MAKSPFTVVSYKIEKTFTWAEIADMVKYLSSDPDGDCSCDAEESYDQGQKIWVCQFHKAIRSAEDIQREMDKKIT